MSSSESYSDVVRIARDLIRIDTSNWGGGRVNPESAAADYLEPLLRAAGFDIERYEAEPGRTNMIARWKGTEGGNDALLLHAHLDVVPADPEAWTHGPFDGDIADGMLWGRGAVDMKNFAAMIVSAVCRLAREGFRPRQDLVLAFFADEEAGTTLGSDWMVEHHAEVFEGVTAAVGEGGGYSVTIGDRRAYLMNTGEKGVRWVRLVAKGKSGHGSLPAEDNAALKLAQALARVGDIEWPVVMTETTRSLLDSLAVLAGADADAQPEELAELAGASTPRILAGLRDVANITMINSGYKENVVPETASAMIDLRFIPGRETEALAQIRDAVGPEIEVSTTLELIAFESTNAGAIPAAIEAAVLAEDPSAKVLPHLIPGGTDAKPLRRLGIDTYGFIPLRLPQDFAFPRMFHGIDERVPLDALEFGERVIRSVIASR